MKVRIVPTNRRLLVEKVENETKQESLGILVPENVKVDKEDVEVQEIYRVIEVAEDADCGYKDECIIVEPNMIEEEVVNFKGVRLSLLMIQDNYVKAIIYLEEDDEEDIDDPGLAFNHGYYSVI